MSAATNQCDGCAAGMPVVNGIHQQDGKLHMGCTADRYTLAGHPVSAASGEPEWNGERILSEIENAVGDASNSVHDSTEWWGSFFADGSSIYESYILPAAERVAGAYDRLAQQRDAAVRERVSLLEQLRLATIAEANADAEADELRARLAACEGERDRLRAVLDWIDDNVGLKEQYDSKYSVPTSTFFGVVEGFHGSLEDAANEYLDGHARTVNRTPPQDAATTRGEG